MEQTIINAHISARNPNRKNADKGGSGLLMSKEHCFALDRTPHLVSDTSQCSQESEGLNLGLPIAIKVQNEIMKPFIDVLVSPKSTNTQTNYLSRSL
jgi:hypothetical protein